MKILTKKVTDKNQVVCEIRIGQAELETIRALLIHEKHRTPQCIPELQAYNQRNRQMIKDLTHALEI